MKEFARTFEQKDCYVMNWSLNIESCQLEEWHITDL